jgi:putative ABC transport system permease protein
MIKNYFKIAWRNLFKNKVYGGINIIGLAIGIASFILILLYMNYELSYDKWHGSLKKVYRLGMEDKNGIVFDGATPAPLGQFFKDNTPKVAAATTLSGGGNYEILVTAGEKKIFQSGIVEVDSFFFKVFPYELQQGDKDLALNTPNAAIISEEVSRKLFGNENPVNKTIKLYNAFDVTITGVLKTVDAPVSLNAQILFRSPYAQSNNHWGNYSYTTYLKLDRAETTKELDVDLNKIYYEQRIKKDSASFAEYQQTAEKITLFAERLADIHNFPKSGGSNFQTITVLLGLAFLLLLAGAINFSNLSVATSIRRAREVGVRKVLGSGRGRIFWQFMSESAVLGLISLTVAILLLFLVVPYFKQEFNIPFRLFDITNGVIYLQVIICMLVVVLLSGLYPAVFLSRFNTTKVLKGDYSQGKKGMGLRNTLLVAQFTLSAFFIFGVVVVNKQMRFMQNRDKGFVSNQVLRINVQQKTGEADFDMVRNKLLAIPGVAYVSKSTTVPGDVYIDTTANTYKVEGREVRLATVKVSKDYFKTLNAPIVQGRDFEDNYNDQHTRSVVLNEAAVSLLGLTDPIDKNIAYPYCDTFQARVIGVVKDFNVQNAATNIRPVAYSIGNKACGYMWGGGLLVKLNSSSSGGTIKAIENLWSSIEPAMPLRYSFLDDNFQKLYLEYNRIQRVIGFFTMLAVVIAIMGLFALTAFLIKERTREIGIRKILGADVTHITFLVSKNFLRLIAIAVMIALPVGWWVSQQWLQTFAYRATINWTAFLLTVAAVFGMAVVTIGWQTIKAARSNPVKNLRTE